MYNTERKQNFIQEKITNTTTLLGYWTSCFNMTEPFEQELGKDICDFSETELISMCKQFNCGSENYAITIISKINLYINWCLQHGYTKDSQNHIANVYQIVIKQAINMNKANMYVDRDTVMEIVQRAAQINPQDAFIFLAIYEGITGNGYKDLLELKMSDLEQIDGQYYAHLSSGKTIKISEDLFEYAKQTDSAVFFYAANGKGIRKMLYESSLYICKYVHAGVNKTKEEKQDRADQIISRAIIRALKYSQAEKLISRSTLLMSGRVNYINQRCAEEGINAKQYLESETYREEFSKRYDIHFISSQANTFYDRYKDYLLKQIMR